jgi:hypothetical protein
MGSLAGVPGILFLLQAFCAPSINLNEMIAKKLLPNLEVRKTKIPY